MKILFALFTLFSLLLNASTMYLTTSSNPSRINPLLATDSASSTIASWIFNGLVKYDKDGKIVGELAKEFYFENNTTVIFKLRKNVTWHDGQPFSADDVVFTYHHINDKKVITPYKNEFRLVKDVQALDPYTVKVTYKHPYFKALHTWMMGIVPKHLLEHEENPMTATFNQNPIGTGPYKLKKLEFSKQIELVANENYFEHPPHIKNIVYSIVADPTTSYLMLQSKQLDMGGLTPLQFEREIDKPFKEHFQIVEQIDYAYTYLGFNLTKKKFQDKRVREAIALAIDRQALIDILFFSHGQACYGPFLPKSFAFNEQAKQKTNDHTRAKTLLKEAGYTKENPLTFEITTNGNNSTRVYAAQIIQHQLKQIGIHASIRILEWQAFLNTVVFPRAFDTVVLGWSLSLMPDAYSIWHSDGRKQGGFNFVGYKNETVDQLITASQKMVDQKELSQTYQTIFEHIANDYPYIFLYIPNTITAINKKISPIEPSITGVLHNQIDWIKE
jgi:peptide/nickel transport system substrate-binding protein